MKRTIKLFLELMIIFIMIAFNCTKQIDADIGMVNWDPYYAWCIQKDGITVEYNTYGDNSVYIPYGARIYIWHGDNYDKAYDQNDSYFAYYGENSFSFYSSIKGADIRPVRKNPDAELLSYESLQLLTIGTADVYDGPSADFKKVFTINEGERVSSDYNDGMWAHVIYEDKEGWLYYNQTLMSDARPNVIIANYDQISIYSEKGIDICSSLNDDEPVDTIAAGSKEVSYIGLSSTSFSNKMFYVNYQDDKKGWIHNEDNELIFEVDSNTLYANEDLVLYDTLDNEKVAAVVLSGETADVSEIVFDDKGYERYYCEYDGKNGWTSSKANCFVDKGIIGSHEKGFTENDADLYSFPEMGRTGQVMNANEEFVILSSLRRNETEWNYVKNETKEGWIRNEIKKHTADDDEEYEDTKQQIFNNSIPSVFYYYGAGALIVTVSALVLIRYLNISKRSR